MCSVLSLREFIEWLPFPSKEEMSAIANKHDIEFFRSRLTIIRLHMEALHHHA